MYFLKYYFQKMSMRTLSFSSVNEMLLSHLAWGIYDLLHKIKTKFIKSLSQSFRWLVIHLLLEKDNW